MATNQAATCSVPNTAAASYPFRAVVYLTGDIGAHAADILRLQSHVEAQGWSVARVRSDVEATKTAWLRQGLLSAITIICHGQADCIVMSQSTFDGFLPDDQNWLMLRLKRFDGFLHIVPAEDEARS